jgi:hydroxymethylpyrimidine/phosphomethylpyrimidine kinase
MRTALSIAGSDPSGGAGLQADLQVFANHGIRAGGVLTALTIQDSCRVHKVLPVFPSVVLDQLRTLLADITPAVVKIGMLATDDVARNVQLGLSTLDEAIPIVIDPVLASSDGTPLLERRAWPVLGELMRRSELATPNLVEAELLTDIQISRRADCERAARVFIEKYGCKGVLIKGGHRAGPPDDLLALSRNHEVQLSWFQGSRIDGGPVHGTGCALASSIAAGLARGLAVEESVARARDFVASGIRNAQAVGSGASFLDWGDRSG